MAEKADTPTSDHSPVWVNEPDEAQHEQSIVCVHGQGDRRSRSPTRRRKHKKYSGKLSHDDRESISRDHERLDRHSGNDSASDAARRHCERPRGRGQDGGQGERAPSAQTSQQLNSEIISTMRAEMRGYMKQLVKQDRKRKRSRSSSSSSSSSSDSESSSSSSDTDLDNEVSQDRRHLGGRDAGSRARPPGKRRSKSGGNRHASPLRRREDAVPEGRHAYPSSDEDAFDGLNQMIQAATKPRDISNEHGYEGFAETIREMETFFEAGDKVGDKVNDAFAGIFSSSLRQRPSDKALLATADKYARPENVPNLLVPKTNDVIWDRMRKGPQIVDAHLQKIQTCVSKTLVPLITITNDIGEGKSRDRPIADLAQPITDTLRLGCAAFSLLSQARKEVIRNDMSSTFAKLCTWKYEVGTEQLFSNDVIKQLKELKETSRQFSDLTHKPGTSGNGYRKKFTGKRGYFKNKSTNNKPYGKGHKHGKNKGDIDEVCVHNNLQMIAQSPACAPTSSLAHAPANTVKHAKSIKHQLC